MNPTAINHLLYGDFHPEASEQKKKSVFFFMIKITNLEDLWHWQRYALFVVLLVSCPVSLDPGTLYNKRKKKLKNDNILDQCGIRGIIPIPSGK